MRYVACGKNGPKVSRIGFGAMRLPLKKKGDWGSINFSKAIKIMRAAMELGVNFFDSHHLYHNGFSEVAIGKALRGWKKQCIYIQTKTPMYNTEPLSWHQQKIEEALEKLGVNCIDYLLFHSMDLSSFNKRCKDFITLTDWAIKNKYIRFRGFSSHESPENIKRFIDTHEFSVMLVSYNYFNPKMQETIAYAASKDMGVNIMNPIGGGTLAANTTQILRLLPGAKTASEVAIRYALDTPGAACTFSGMSTLEQVQENAAIANRKLMFTPHQRHILMKSIEEFGVNSPNFCSSCAYCMPCPHGVDIPNNFVHLNRSRFLGLTEAAFRAWTKMKINPNGDISANACKQCGLCLSKCPNKISIIEQLSAIKSMMKGNPSI